MEFNRILVPVKDGGKADEGALKLACRLARKSKGKVFAVYVIEVQRALPLEAQIDPEIRKGEKVLDRAERLVEEEDYEVGTELLQAREVAPAIVDAAVDSKVDLILMGLIYKRTFGEFSLGTITPYVLKNAPCPVLVLRESAS